MRKIKFGSVEIFGYIGIITWVTVNLLRGYAVSDHAVYVFLLGILPNLGAAWGMTMFGKWGVVFILKKKITFKIHLCLCAGVFALALLSEIIHHLYLNSPFDIYDIIITAFAQIAIFTVPLFLKDEYFGNFR